MSAAPWEIRLAHLEGAYEQVSARLGGIEGRLGRVEAKIDEQRSELTAKIDDQRSELAAKIDRLRSDQNSQFRWVIGLIVVSILLPFAGRLIAH